MSFIDKFLDVTNNLPRKIVRILKLYKFVENLSREKNTDLKKLRTQYLNIIKEKDSNNTEVIRIKNTIDKNFKDILTLSDYKNNLINELKYILENNFLDKIAPIIEDGKKECEEQIASSSNNLPYSSNFVNPVFTKINSDDLSISELNEKNKKSDKMLGLKTNRNNRNRNKKLNPGNNNEYSEENQKNNINGEPEKVYCICKKPDNDFNGPMIECDTCKEWYHFELN